MWDNLSINVTQVHNVFQRYCFVERALGFFLIYSRMLLSDISSLKLCANGHCCTIEYC